MSYGNQPPQYPYQAPPQYQQYPSRPPKQGMSALLIILIVGVVSIPVLLICAGLLVGLTLPAVQAAREAARRANCANNLRSISIALLNYEAMHRSFPPAYTVDSQGNRLHSWRTLLLPYIEQQALYAQIDLTKPWNDPVNLPFSQIDVPVYRCPSSPVMPGMTTYVVVDDPKGIFSGANPSTLPSITDGMTNTLVCVEVDMSRAVGWMEPKDTDINQLMNNLATPSTHSGGFHVAFADGAVQFISSSIGANLNALVTKSGGEIVPAMR